MQNTISPQKNLLFKDDKSLAGRQASFKETDKSALYAIVQAAVNVELFTIPLYMTSLYSLQGMHQITGQNNFYEGRTWPGMSTTAEPKTDNEKAFNAVFSVFIAEMLHLQLVSNICKVVGYEPIYTSEALQSKNFGWTCYSETETILPHILDFKDTIAPYNQIKVKLGPLNKEQVELFLVIEETENDAHKILNGNESPKYISTVPFAGWNVSKTEKDLPYFGSIGQMYLRLWEYLSIQYDDTTTLWDYVYESAAMQQDLFNIAPADKDQPDNKDMDEYPGMHTVVDSTNNRAPLKQVLDMINGITDQGEGAGVVAEILKRSGADKSLLQAVKPNYQPSYTAMEKKYPSYSDTGCPMKSKDASARHSYGAMDHFETFQFVMGLVEKGEIKTWDQWHKEGNKWTAEMLKTASYDKNTYPIPKADDIAGALNRLKEKDNQTNYIKFSHTSAGAIAGVTTVLNKYFNDKSTGFPYPSMSGSGDRMSICWAIFGKAPDLSMGIVPKSADANKVLYHSCQGLNLDPNIEKDANSCAPVEVFHTCKGSNDCKAEGGCGFVQSTQGGSGCGAKVNSNTADLKVEGNCGRPAFYSAPSDNKCKTFGGCAIPISASQMFPAPKGPMELNDYVDPGFTPEAFTSITYKQGELVHDVAWTAYCEVLKHRGKPAPEKPNPSDIRLAFTPST